MVSASTHGGLAARSPSSWPDPGRSARDRAVDIGLVLLAVGVGLVGFVRESQRPGGLSDGLLLVDLAVGSVACLALLLRRRRPVELAAVLSVAGAFSVVAGCAARRYGGRGPQPQPPYRLRDTADTDPSAQ